jgi:hypothetical protein
MTSKTTTEPLALLPTPPKPPPLCNACGATNLPDATRCESCGSERFAPAWVRALRKADRNFSVQVDDPHEKSDSTEPILSFYKWWQGGRANFKIRDQGQWERLKEIVDTDLAPVLGWSSKEEALATLSAAREQSNGLDDRSRAILEHNPGLIVDLARALAGSAIDTEDLSRLEDVCERIAAVAVNVETAHGAAIRRSFGSVSEGRETGPRQLASLTEKLLRSDDRAAQAELRRRVGVLELFAEHIEDERSYKITNYRSAIHRLLEQSIWILDERYWLGEEVSALRVALDRAVAERDRPYAKKPPDFACGILDERLIVAAIQAPSKELDIADLDQLERHVAACFEVQPFAAFEAILVGKTASEELRKTLELRDRSFRVKTYSQLIDERWRDYRSRLDGDGPSPSPEAPSSPPSSEATSTSPPPSDS